MPNNHELADTIEIPNGRVVPWVAKSLLGVFVTIVMAHASWATMSLLDVREKQAMVVQRQNELSTRLENLKSGRTIKMADTTRAELNAIWRELGKRP